VRLTHYADEDQKQLSIQSEENEIREAPSREERMKCNGGKLTEEKAFRIAGFLGFVHCPEF
jgi:hypothetical protein